jgi:hypothetical protein
MAANQRPSVSGRVAPTARGLTMRCKFESLEALQTIGDYLSSETCQIEVLILSVTSLSQMEVQELFSALSLNHSISELAIYASSRETSQSMKGRILQSLLEGNTRIERLTLVQLHLDLMAAIEIAQGLARHSLQSLSLDCCSCNSEVTAVLMEALQWQENLTTVHLGQMHLSERALDAVTTLLAVINHLRK